MNSEAPLVCVIMPAYNAEKYIAESISSVVHQSYQNWELIVINDGSTDQTLQIVEEFLQKDKRIRLANHETNKGLILARNKGLECAKGKYIANLDSDDIAMPSRLEKQVQFLEEHKSYVLLGTACEIINSNGERQQLIRRNIPNEQIKTLLLFSNYFINSSVMMKADLAKEIGYVDDVPLSEDYQLFVALSNKGDLGNLDIPLVKYREHGSNISKEKEAELAKEYSEIQLRQIQKLGLSPSEQEMKLHSSLVEGNTSALGFDLAEVEVWLLKLIKANQGEKVYEDNLLKYFSAFFYRRACENSKLGIKSIATYRKSTLAKYNKGDIKGNSIFFVKSLLKIN